MDEKIILASAPVEVAEYPDYKLATFLISVLDEYDLNARMIPKETAVKCGETLVGAPILAKLIYNPLTGKPCDFGGHEVYWTTDDDGNDVIKFGTEPIGSVTMQWIESRAIDGFESPKDCLMIQAKLWTSRFPEYTKVLDRLWNERKICSSWELTVHDAIRTIQGAILKSVTFLGNCIIGCEPAVPQAGIIEYASVKDKTDELELMAALSRDIAAKDDNNEKGNVEMEENSNIQNEQVASTVEETVEKTETQAAAEIVDPLFSYEIEDDCIKLSDCKEELVIELVNKANTIIDNLNEMLAQRDTALSSANDLVNDLKAQVAELTPFKEEHDKLEAERLEAELQAKRDAVKDVLIRSERVAEAELESDEFKTIIENADMASAKAIIADRFMASMPEKREVASAERPAPRLDADEESFNIKKFLATRKH